jgi:glycerol-3-phosphate acyltransferase PlsY
MDVDMGANLGNLPGTTLIGIITAGLVAYILGSLPFALWISRARAGVDLRKHGSGHAGATNTMRVAGWGAGLSVLVLDVGKGSLAVWLADRISAWPWVSALAGGMVVLGHCWPILAGFRGGMGMASGAGALLAAWPLGFVLAVGLGSLSQLLVRHTARGNVLAGLLVAPLWAVFGVADQLWLTAAVVGCVVAFRASSDWSRVYQELWLDREQE